MANDLKEAVVQSWEENVVVAKQYICEEHESKSGVCTECKKYSNRIYEWPVDANRMPELPIHPNCKCHYIDLTIANVRALASAEKRENY